MRPVLASISATVLIFAAAPALAFGTADDEFTEDAAAPGETDAKAPAAETDVEAVEDEFSGPVRPRSEVLTDYEPVEPIVPVVAEEDVDTGSKPGVSDEVAPPTAAPTAPPVEEAAAPEAAPVETTVAEGPSPGAPGLLRDASLRDALEDQSLFGCFTDGSQWGELTSSNGMVFDLLNDNVQSGRWSVNADRVCYTYPYQEGTPSEDCFRVYRVGSHLDFHLQSEGDRLVASTDCSSRVVTGEPARSPTPTSAPGAPAAPEAPASDETGEPDPKG